MSSSDGIGGGEQDAGSGNLNGARESHGSLLGSLSGFFGHLFGGGGGGKRDQDDGTTGVLASGSSWTPPSASEPPLFDLSDLQDHLSDDMPESGIRRLDRDPFLGEYSKSQLEEIVRKSDIGKCLTSSGFDTWTLLLDTSDSFVHRVTIIDPTVHPGPLPVPENAILLDMFVRRKNYVLADFKTYQLLRQNVALSLSDSSPTANGASERDLDSRKSSGSYRVANDAEDRSHLIQMLEKVLPGSYDITCVEWLILQNPRKSFSKDKPQLPGQKFPGLHIARALNDLLMSLAKRGGRDALVNIPDAFHNAFLYSRKGYKFLSPVDLENDLVTHGLAAVSWAFKWGHVKNIAEDKSIEAWDPQEQVFPTGRPLKAYFESHAYKQLEKEHLKKGRFVIDWQGATEALKFSVKGFEEIETGTNFEQDSARSSLIYNLLHPEQFPASPTS